MKKEPPSPINRIRIGDKSKQNRPRPDPLLIQERGSSLTCKRLRISLLVVALVVFDQITKIAVYFKGVDQQKESLGGIYLTLNHGVLPVYANMLISVSLLTALFIFFLTSGNTTFKYAVVLIIAGGISNTIDRFYLHTSVDIINIFELNLNIADIYIITGAALALYKLVSQRKSSKG